MMRGRATELERRRHGWQRPVGAVNEAKKSLIHERRECGRAGVVIEMPKAGCLWKRQAQARHLSIFTTDAIEEILGQYHKAVLYSRTTRVFSRKFFMRQ